MSKTEVNKISDLKMSLDEQNFKNLCHFCLIKGKRLKSIYEKTFKVPENGENFDLCVVDFISLITNTKMQDGNEFPKFVCTKCSKQIDNFMKFRLNCIKSFEHLHNIQLGITCVDPIENIKCEVSLLNNSTEYNTNDEENSKTNNRTTLSRSKKNNLQTPSSPSHVECGEIEIKEESIEDSMPTIDAIDSFGDADGNISDQSDNRINSDNDDGACWEPSTMKIEKPPKSSRKKQYHTSDSEVDDDLKGTAKKRKSKKQSQKKCESTICTICGGSFKYMSAHIKIHSTERPFPCELCDWRFREKSNLESHVKTVHLNLRPNKCEKCGKGFNTKKNLKLHILSHSTERNFKCEICGLKFKLPTTLRNHMVTHRQNRRFECVECGKTFLTKTEHTQHSWIHTGEKPHPCKICDKRFRTAGMRRVHELHVHSEVFKAEPKRFRININLVEPVPQQSE